MKLTEAQAVDLSRRVAALAGLPPDALADLRAAPGGVRLDTRYRPPRGRRRVFCAYFDPARRRVVLRARLAAQLPAEAVGPLVAQTCAHAVLTDAALDSGLPPADVRRQIDCGLRHAGPGPAEGGRR
jgi:hypothetical protein